MEPDRTPTSPGLHSEDAEARSLGVAELIVMTFASVVMNTSHRMIYPFLPEIGRGLAVQPGTMRLLVSARSAMGFASPLFGPASDRYGRQAIMAVGLAILTISLLLVPLSPVLMVSMVALALTSLPKLAYTPAVQAYIGDRVPYERRGRVFGIVETSWSIALLVGAPVIGFGMQRFGWSSPFWGLAAFSALAWLATMRFIRRDTGAPGASITSVRAFVQSWGFLLRHPAALGALGYAFLMDVANENVFVVYGYWMEGNFGLQVAALGLFTAVIGIADLVGELVVTTLADRIGKRRMVVISLVVSSLAYVGLPWLGVNRSAALVMLFLMFLGFEITNVASGLIVSELVPAARGSMMAFLATAYSVGRALGALLAGPVWKLGGFALNGAVSGVVNLLALALFLAVVARGMHADKAREVPDAIA